MTDVVHTIAASVLWLVVVYRAGMVREGGTQRSLWLALVSLACGQTLQIKPAYDVMESALGVPGGAAVAKHVLALGAAAGVLLLLRGLTGSTEGARRLSVLAGLALAAMLAPLFLDHQADVPLELEQRAEFYASSWSWVVHWAAFLLYLSWALAGATRMCSQYGRHAPAGPLRTGLRLVGLGTTVGFGYVALKVTVVVAGFFVLSPLLVGIDQAGEAAILGCSVILIAVGSGYEALALRWSTLAGYVAMRRSMRRLYPLWKDLYEAVPYIALSPGASGSLLSAPLSTRDRLYRRVMEIRDGLLALRPYAHPEVRSRALAAATAAGRCGADADAVAEAVWLKVALRARMRGAAAAPSGVTRRAVGGTDFSEEVRWLEHIAVAHRSCPLVTRLESRDDVLNPARVGAA